MEECRRWEDNIKMDLEEVGVDVMSQLSVESPCERGIVPAGFLAGVL